MSYLTLGSSLDQGLVLYIDPNCSDEEVIHEIRSKGVFISISALQHGHVKLSISAPQCVRIAREELIDPHSIDHPQNPAPSRNWRCANGSKRT